MANANPAMTTPQVFVTYSQEKKMGGSNAVMKTHYRQTLKQADRIGVLRLDDEGKIAEVLDDKIVINIPAGLYKEDIYTIEFLKDIFDTTTDNKEE